VRKSVNNAGDGNLAVIGARGMGREVCSCVRKGVTSRASRRPGRLDPGRLSDGRQFLRLGVGGHEDRRGALRTLDLSSRVLFADLVIRPTRRTMAGNVIGNLISRGGVRWRRRGGGFHFPSLSCSRTYWVSTTAGHTHGESRVFFSATIPVILRRSCFAFHPVLRWEVSDLAPGPRETLGLSLTQRRGEP
jgi:hypothetical protein